MLISFWLIISMIATGVTSYFISVDEEQILMMKSFNASKMQILMKLIMKMKINHVVYHLNWQML